MKKFLLVALLACGATAFANNTDPHQEKRATATMQHTAKESARQSKADTAVAKPEADKPTRSTSHICSDNSRYGIGAYIVEFINRNNVKIMKKLLAD